MTYNGYMTIQGLVCSGLLVLYDIQFKVAARGRRWRVSVSAGARLDQESGRQNVHETVARARFHTKITKKLAGSNHFFKMRSANHSFQFVRFSSFVSIHACQEIHLNSFISFI